MKLSVQILAGNCAHTIKRCLDSVKDLNSEIIIVLDTRHPVYSQVYDIITSWYIANTVNVSIYTYDWHSDSFADARNYGLTFAKGDWILYLDADEELQNFEMPDDKYDYYLSTVTKEDCRFKTIRMFKRGYTFTGARHNQLATKIDTAKLGENNSVFHGFTTMTPEEIEAKTRGLLERHIQQLTDEPNNQMLHFHICRCHFGLKEWEHVKETGHLALQDPLENGHWAMVMIYLYIAYKSTGRGYAAEQWINKSVALVPDQLWGWCLIYEDLCNKEQWEQAEFIKNIIMNTTVSNIPYDMNEEQTLKIYKKYKITEKTV